MPGIRGTGSCLPRYEPHIGGPRMQTWSIVCGVVVFAAGVVSLLLAPIVGSSLFKSVWTVEPLTYIGGGLVALGLGVVSLSYALPGIRRSRTGEALSSDDVAEQWRQLTQQYFALFNHDLGRPLRRISGQERELRAVLLSSGKNIDPNVLSLLEEIEMQTTNFRLMLSNIQVLVDLEGPDGQVHPQPVEPSEVVRRIVDRYTPVAEQTMKEITWWAEPSEFGLVYSDSSAIEHIVTNLVDNAVRFADSHIEIKLTRNPTHFFVRVWDDGPGVSPQYVQHVFDHGWTPEVARREEKSSSGLGLFIARTLANRWHGELTVESVSIPGPEHHSEFLLGLPHGGHELVPDDPVN